LMLGVQAACLLRGRDLLLVLLLLQRRAVNLLRGRVLLLLSTRVAARFWRREMLQLRVGHSLQSRAAHTLQMRKAARPMRHRMQL